MKVVSCPFFPFSRLAELDTTRWLTMILIISLASLVHSQIEPLGELKLNRIAKIMQ